MATDITVSREYLLTLIRRAELTLDCVTDHPTNIISYAAEHEDPAIPTVRIAVSEYKELQNASKEYRSLVNALVAAGTPLESIQILARSSEPLVFSEDGSTTPATTWSRDSSPPLLHFQTSSNDPGQKNLSFKNSLHKRLSPQSPSFPTPIPSDEEMVFSEDNGDVDGSQELGTHLDTYGDRSLILKGVPESASLADIAKIVRGGMILTFWIRRQRGTAHVAFVQPEVAEKFLIYAGRNQLSIKGKNVTVSWDERQYYLTDGLARCIDYDGATQNLVIRFPKPEVTEKIIREDLEHIYSLEIVDIHFRNGHAWISLNSVKHALTARSCMSSRLRYRGYRIEFWPDECAASLPTRKKTQPKKRSYAQRPASKTFSNRFMMLNDENAGSDGDCNMDA